jgi:hypothetical protein
MAALRLIAMALGAMAFVGAVALGDYAFAGLVGINLVILGMQ